ncbi:MAG TPA: response regulator transcription factor [Gemmatimonadales bacterium]|nr:response regulator transcription factor [Gemmatimonadales bacterium]
MKAPLKVLVVDDHSVVREGLRRVLEEGSGGDLRVVAEAANGAEAVERAVRDKPDVVLLDLTMPGPGGSGLAVVRTLRDRAPDARVLILSVHDDREYVLESVRAGAHGYLRKDSSPAEIRQAIHAVCAGDSFFSPPVARHLAAAVQDASQPPAGSLAALTARERDVLVGVASGRTNRETAAALGISVRTVETHRNSLMRKLGIHTVAELTRFALEHRLIADRAADS